MGECRPSSLGVAREGGYEGCNRSAYVLAHCQRRSLFETESRNLHVEEHEGNCHGGGGCLYEHGNQRAYYDEQYYREETSARHVGKHGGHQLAYVEFGG